MIGLGLWLMEKLVIQQKKRLELPEETINVMVVVNHGKIKKSMLLLKFLTLVIL
jgi:hypothetical protein